MKIESSLLTNIRNNKKILLLLVSIIFFIFIFSFHLMKIRELKNEFNIFERAQKNLRETFPLRKELDNSYASKHGLDEAFLDNLEKLSLLNSEKIFLRKFCGLAIKKSRYLDERYNFLDKENILLLTDAPLFSSETHNESLVKLSRPLEIDETDLEKILFYLENAKNPQIFITNFVLKKLDNGNFEINFDFFKREYKAGMYENI